MIFKKPETSGQEPETKPVVDLLTAILEEFRQQVQSKTPKPLEGAALQAVERFKEIGATLALLPTITLTAVPDRFDTALINVPAPTFKTKLTWSSTEAQTVSIVGVEERVGGAVLDIGEVKPAAGGSIEVDIFTTTRFTATATAKGPCNSATAEVLVTVGGIIIQ